MKKILQFWTLAAVPLLLYLPLFANPNLFLQRGNDLQEFFWPAMYFVKNQILKNHALPLWNPMYLSGYPLIADPQAPLFYLPNIIILLLPIDTGIILSILLHTIFAALFFYVLANKGLNLNHRSSIFSALVYILIPRLSAYLEAGHLGLIFAHTWIPLVIYSALQISRQKSAKFPLLYAAALAMLFFTHTITFLVIAGSCGIVAVVNWLLDKKIDFKCLFTRLAISHIILFGFVAIALLPQIAWSGLSTRQILLNHPETYPIWDSKLEFLKAVIIGWNVSNIDTEKTIAVGIVPLFLSSVAFLKLKKKLQVILAIVLSAVLLISLNNASPIYQLLISQNWFVLMRVSTRVWIIPTIIVCLFSGFIIQKLKAKFISYLVMLIAIAELFSLSWKIQAKQPTTISNVVPQKVIDFVKSDTDHFRIFCTTGCISQKTAVINNVELIEGYNTLQQMNYYQYAWQFSGEWWDYYTLAIPPFGIRHQKLQNIDTNALGMLNTKYVISPYEIGHKSLELVNDVGGYLVYLNKEYLPRAFTWPDKKPIQVLEYTPNKISIDTFQLKNNTQIVLSEIHSPGWTVNDQQIEEDPAILRSTISDGNQTVFIFNPPLYKLGFNLSEVTLLSVSFYFVFSFKKNTYRRNK